MREVSDIQVEAAYAYLRPYLDEYTESAGRKAVRGALEVAAGAAELERPAPSGCTCPMSVRAEFGGMSATQIGPHHSVGCTNYPGGEVKIEIHDDDGHTYTYERGKGDSTETFRWTASVDGRVMPKMSENFDGRDVLWQMALLCLNAPGPLADSEHAAIQRTLIV